MNTGAGGGAAVRTKIIKDIVHTFIRLPEDFVASIVDTPLLQRMRRIQQLSLAQQVYPGAVHTRFEHSLGVAYTMKMALESIRQNLEEIIIPSISSVGGVDEGVRSGLSRFLDRLGRELGELEKEAVTAALIHDIGHIGMGHVAEMGLNDRLLVYYPSRPGVVAPTMGMHEDIVILMARLMSWSGMEVLYSGRRVDLETVYEILEYAYSENRKPLCTREVEFSRPRSGKLDKVLDLEFRDDSVRRVALCIIARLLDSNIDVDRADYILRDSIHTGNISGVYDINRYYAVITVVPKVQGAGANTYRASFMLGILDKGISVVENMLLSRIYMYTDVYLHDISMIYSAMVARIMAILYLASLNLLHDSQEDPRARDILDRHPYLDALARFMVAIRLGDVDDRGIYSELARRYGSLRDLEPLLVQLTDDAFYSTLASIYTGRSRDLLEYISGMDSWGGEACLATALYTHGVIARRHASALIATGERTTRLISSIEGYEAQADNVLRRGLRPLIVVNWARHRPYKDTVTHRIHVFRRRQPLSPVELHADDRAMVTRKIRDEAYSKILIVFPGRLGEARPPNPWRVRGGNLARYIEGGLLDGIAGPCGVGREEAVDMLRMAARGAVELADTLMSLV